MLIGKPVEPALRNGDVLPQQGVRLFLGDAVFHVPVVILIRAAGTVAHRILGIVPVGLCGEALQRLQQRNAGIAGAQRGRHGRSLKLHCGYRAEQENHGKKNGKNFSFHGKMLLL